MIGYTNSSSSSSSAQFNEGIIDVTWVSGEMCSVTNGLVTLTAPNTSGNYQFKVPDGVWVVSCFNNSISFTKTVTIGRGETVNVDLT